MEKIRPKIGIGMYITDGKGNLLMMLRKGPNEAGTWSPPGGHLEMGESFLECCKKEVKEEVGLDLEDIEMLGTVNNIFSEQKHYVNVDFLIKGVSGKPIIGESDKCAEIGWYSIDNLPQPLMLSSVNLFKAYPDVLEKLKSFNSLA
ncbi:MAG: NUDIX domain-containing protein [Candidatus Doudnabacteria bacterium]|nr:NUDIX domain-containing protein [Candidatus Doudnabacteria bacterium]